MEIKGIKEGILISFQDQEWQVVKESLIQKITEKGTFFQGAQLVLDVGQLVLGTNALEELREILNRYNVSLYGLLSKSMVTQEAARRMGLITKLRKPAKIDDDKMWPIEAVLKGEAAVLIPQTIPPGLIAKYQGHVIVLGDVSHGSEIIATGSVIVWGRLYGNVHAGADGDQTTVVCALDLAPNRLQIAEIIAITPEDQAEPIPEVARILDGQIIAEPWQNP
ncbi:MAG: septum site-determining protein MinC [Anaerolineaceae bacterium]